MCRWIAYSGRAITLEHYVTQPSHSLVVQSLRALESTVGLNGDGFGLGWYGAGHPEPGTYHEVRPAWSDSNLKSLCRHLSSHLFFAHVRAATGTPVTRTNCHPFTFGRWLFMHNGYLANWPRMRRTVETLIPDDIYNARGGTTDSEAMFLVLLAQGLADETAANDPVEATRKLLARLTEMAGDEPLLFTAALSDGRDLYAFRYGVNATANSLYYRASPSGVVVVSEPLDDDRATWVEVPSNAALIARAGESVQLTPLLS